jgi:DNA replication and repair protein RecF
MIEKILLKNFRQFENQFFDFQPNLNLIIGQNTSGKTTILESLHLLSHGESFRTTSNIEFIKFKQNFTYISGYCRKNEELLKLEITSTNQNFNEQVRASKKFKVNNQPKRKKDFLGNLITICFRPEDLRLVEGSPSRRRNFLDSILKIVDSRYNQALISYEKNLKSRNRLLAQVREKQAPENLLKYFNQRMIRDSNLIYQKRLELINFLNTSEFPLKFQISYLFSKFTQEKIDKNQNKEILLGRTLSGPQKDDFEISYQFDQEFLPIIKYGSRAQQRLATLFLKIAEFEFLKQEFKTNPIILLDDILSELDSESQKLLLPLLKLSQTIITSSDFESRKILEKNNLEFNLIELGKSNLS